MITTDHFIVTILKKSINKEQRYPNVLTPCETKCMINCGTTGTLKCSICTCGCNLFCKQSTERLSKQFWFCFSKNKKVLVFKRCLAYQDQMFSHLSDRCLYFSCLNFKITLLYIFSFCVWLGWNHASLETCCWSPAHKLSWVFPNYLLGNNQLIVAGSCWQFMGEVGCKDVYSATLKNSFWLLWI